MFLFRKSVIYKKILPAVLIVGFLAAVMGCSNGTTDEDINYPGTLPEGLVGQWVYDADNYYEIMGDTFKYHAAYNDPRGGYSDYGFAGTIQFVSNYTNDSGIIIVKITSGYFDSSKPFCGIYYKGLTAALVQIANAIDLETYASVDTATFDEAIKKFTQGQMANYVGFWGTYTKTR